MARKESSAVGRGKENIVPGPVAVDESGLKGNVGDMTSPGAGLFQPPKEFQGFKSQDRQFDGVPTVSGGAPVDVSSDQAGPAGTDNNDKASPWSRG